MKDIIKKVLLFIMTATLFICAGALAGCDSCNETETAGVTVTISRKAATIEVYDKYTLKASASDGSAITWESSAPEIASVSAEGVVEGLKEGSAIIYARAGESRAECRLEVAASASIPYLDADEEMTVLLGREAAINFEYLFRGEDISDNEDAEFTFSSSDSSVAEVNAEGIITPKKAGTVTITMQAGYKDFADQITITVNVVKNVVVLAVTDENGTPIHELALNVGQTVNLSSLVQDENNSSPEVVWAAENNTITIAPNGGNCAVTGSVQGTAKLILTYENEGETYYFDVIVTVRLTKSVVTEYYTRELNGTFRLYDSVSSDFYVGELAEADTDKEIDGYTFNGEYSGNVLDGLVEENGDLVLKCYYEQNGVEGRSPAMLTLADGCAPYVTFGSMPMTGEYEKDAIDGTYFLNATGFTPVNGVQAGSWYTRFNFTLNEQDIGKYLAVNIYYTQLDGVGVDQYKGKMRLWKNVVSDVVPLDEVYRYNSDYTLSDSVETGRWYTLITPLTSDYFKAGSIDISFSEYVDTKAFIADILIVEPEVAQKYYGFSTYTVQHCLQQIDGSYSIADAEEVAGTAGTTYTAAAKTYQGYTFKAEQSVVSGTMPGVGKLVLTLKYDIAEGTDTVALGAGAISPDAAGLAQTITYTAQEMTDIENAMANTYFYSQGTNSGGGSGWSDQMTITLSEDYIGKYLAIKIYYIKETSSVIFWTNKTVGGTEIATVYDEEGNEVTDVSEMTTGKWYTHLLYLNENDYQAGRLGFALGDFKPGMQAYVAAVSLISESTAEQYYGI